MAQKYHINPETGRPNICRADKRGCLYGEDQPHFDSKDEAREYYENANSEQSLVSHSKAKKEESNEIQVEEDYRNTYIFPAERLDDALEKIAKANRKLERYGIEGRYEYETTEEEVKIGKIPGTNTDLTETRVTLKIINPNLAYNGYKFLASVNKEEAGYITRTAPGVEMGGFRPESQYCEHCNSNRDRNTTYLVEGPDGVRKQIGSSCLQAYTGVKIAGLSTIGFEDEMKDFAARRGSETSPRSLNRPSVDMIAYALAVSDEGQNFVSKSVSLNYGMPSTSEDIEQVLWGQREKDYEFTQWQDLMSKRAYEYMKSGEAKKVLEEIQKIEGDSDYITNLRTVANSEYISPRNVPLLVSGLSPLRKKKQKEEKAKQPPAAKGFAGNIKDKMKGRKARISKVSHYTTYDEYVRDEVEKTVITFRDENEHEMVWFASKKIDVKEGEDITFTSGSVKSHREKDGVDQTQLTRVKFE